MIPILRSVGGVIAGVIMSSIIVFVVELLNSFIYPLPQGVDFQSEAMKTHIANAPLAALFVVLLAWFLGAVGGALLSAVIAGRAALIHAGIFGVVFLLPCIFNLVVFSSSVWFWLAGLLAPVAGAAAGGLIAQYLTNRRASPARLA